MNLQQGINGNYTFFKSRVYVGASWQTGEGFTQTQFKANFDNNQGFGHCQFMQDLYYNCYMLCQFLDGVGVFLTYFLSNFFKNYLDQKSAMMLFNLTSTSASYDDKAGWIRFNGLEDVTMMKYFSKVDKFVNCDISLHTQLLDQLGTPLGFNEKTYSVAIYI